MPDYRELMKRHLAVAQVIGEDYHKAVPIFEDCVNYDEAEVAALAALGREMRTNVNAPDIQEKLARFRTMRDSIHEAEHKKEKILLWPNNNMPSHTDYTDNSDYLFNHDPDFIPYMYDMCVAEDVEPKGAVILCAGGDHGEGVVNGAYQVGKDLNALGYQCFILLNRTNHNPWSAQESGADGARAVRYVRAHAQEYRISPDNIAWAGFSNGGITGEACIQYYSASRTVKDSFPEYVEDELDQVSADLNAFLCVYGPRFAGDSFDYENVHYPPSFFAVGRNDPALKNLNYTYNDLIQHDIPAEIHTFAATPHGIAGIKIYDGYVRYPNFELWLPLADAFLKDVFGK